MTLIPIKSWYFFLLLLKEKVHCDICKLLWLLDWFICWLLVVQLQIFHVYSHDVIRMRSYYFRQLKWINKKVTIKLLCSHSFWYNQLHSYCLCHRYNITMAENTIYILQLYRIIDLIIIWCSRGFWGHIITVTYMWQCHLD